LALHTSLLAALIIVGQTLVPTTAAAELIDDAWFQTTIGGKPAGRVHGTVELDESGLLRTAVQSDVIIRRGGSPVRVEVKESWTETEDGRPVAYHRFSKMAVDAVDLDVAVKGDGLHVRKSQGDEVSFSIVPTGSGLLFPEAVRRLHLAHGFAPGDTFSYLWFDPDFETVARQAARVVGREQATVLAGQRELNTVVLVSSLYEGLETTQRYDDEGRLWVEEVPALGLVNARTTRAAALGQEEAGVDIVGSSMIPTNVDIASPAGVDSALYELWMDGGDISALITEDGRQVIEGHTDRGVLLRVFRTVPDAEATESFPVTDPTLAPYLETNQVIDASYPPLREAALGAISDAGQDSWVAATRIERLVFDTIEDKGLGTTFASAREAFDRRSGDCSEHAILAAAMMRSVGIPSRVVAGIVHLRGRFAYHMWIEVWSGGAWYALDPTTGEGSVDATHLKLSESAVPGGRIADLSIGVLRVFSRLHVRVVEYTAGGATVRP
jgi:hypothetical protein